MFTAICSTGSSSMGSGNIDNGWYRNKKEGI